jgi:hypothetical protein
MISTPVVIIGYARPKETLDIINVCRVVKPSKVYFIVDGPKNKEIQILNTKVKQLTDFIDWGCNLQTHFIDKNVGPFEAYNIAMDVAFENEDKLIFLEDDKLPSVSFFYFCDELLDKYKNDERIFFISGMNQKGNYPMDYKYDYFFSSINTSWGHATWKRTYDKFKYSLRFVEDQYYNNAVSKLYIRDGYGNSYMREINNYREKGKHNGHVPSMEFFLLGPLKYLFSSIVIIPRLNLISDVGATTHTANGDEFKLLTKRQQNAYFREIFEIQFPLKHPPFMVVDLNYLKYNKFKYTILYFFEKIQRALLILRYRGINALILKLKKKIQIIRND